MIVRFARPREAFLRHSAVFRGCFHGNAPVQKTERYVAPDRGVGGWGVRGHSADRVIGDRRPESTSQTQAGRASPCIDLDQSGGFGRQRRCLLWVRNGQSEGQVTTSALPLKADIGGNKSSIHTPNAVTFQIAKARSPKLRYAVAPMPNAL